MSKKFALIAAALLAAFTLATCTQEADDTLRVGYTAEPSSLDPHYHNLGPNNAMMAHLFGRLVERDHKAQLIPGLATSWRPLDDTTWEFNLRRGAKFHDGSEFTADDFIYTIERIPNVPNSPSSFIQYTKFIKSISAPDPYTLIIKTHKPYPLAPTDIANIYILSRKASTGKWTEDISKGDGLVGTGPYKFVEWVRGDRLVLERFEDYYGDKPTFEKVIFKPMTNGSARVAAMLAGDVDLIDQVPTADIEQMKKNPEVVISQSVSSRVIYLHMDHDRDNSPFVTGTKNGKNPLRDLRVRKAISKAINRNAIRDQVMEGLSVPAGQILPKGFFGYTSKLSPEKYDPAGARKLLAQAGYPKGFGLTIHGPNNRYINDAKIVQAIAGYLTKIGIRTKVVTMPRNVYFKRATKRLYSFILVGWGSASGEASSALRALLATRDKKAGLGMTNRGRFSNAKMDSLLAKALATVDDGKREKLLQDATVIAIENLGIIPIHFQVNTWATRKGLAFQGRTDERTQIMGISKL